MELCQIWGVEHIVHLNVMVELIVNRLHLGQIFLATLPLDDFEWGTRFYLPKILFCL
jgi:hypothetical protein